MTLPAFHTPEDVLRDHERRVSKEAPRDIERVLTAARAVCKTPIDTPENADQRAEVMSLPGLLMLTLALAMALESRKATGTPSYWRDAHAVANLWRIYNHRLIAETPDIADDPAPEPEPAAKSGFVYIIQAGDRIKIGFATDVARRLNGLRGASPFPIVLLHSMPGTMATERALHKRFAAQRLHGEWFRPEGALADYIAGLTR